MVSQSKATKIVERLKKVGTVPRVRGIITLLVPFLLYLYLTLYLSEWIMDDAGISFTYARNLAHGHGLVSQPGLAPVEGYSNFLWIILMVPFFLLNIFDPFVTAKTVSLVLVAITFYYLHKSMRRLTSGTLMASFTVLICLALNTSFTVWTCSGLENPLFAALITALFYLQLSYVDKKYSPNLTPLIAGLLISAIAMTRPDGIAYVFVFPFIIALGFFSKERPTVGVLLRAFSVYAVTLIVVYGGFTLFRYLYFGELLPNTYYVKGGPSLSMLVPVLTLQGKYLTKFQQLAASVLGAWWWWWVPVGWLSLLTLALSRREPWRKYLLLMVMTFTAGFVYIVMPNDWMGEYRFATPFFLFVYCCFVLLGQFLIVGLPRRRIGRQALGGLLLIFVLYLSTATHLPRLEEFSKRKVVNFTRIARAYGERFNDYAEFLQLEKASFLVPDIGGTLYYSKLRIYDLAGLCDKTIARTRGKDQQRFYDYVFDSLKPTFIHTHGYFTGVSKFDDDPRFQRDYVAIKEYRDKYVERKYKASRISGNFVRRDQIEGREAQLDSLRQGHLP
jgi:hypothetical protein